MGFINPIIKTTTEKVKFFFGRYRIHTNQWVVVDLANRT